MRFTRYPKGETYQIRPRKLAAARRAVQREKDRYPLFPELVKHQTAEDRLTSIAAERETWWQEMRERHANLCIKARQNLNSLPPGPRAAIKRYWKICGCLAILSICSPSFTSIGPEKSVTGTSSPSSVAFDSASKKSS